MVFIGPCKALVPVRDFRLGKSRLASSLDENVRADLSQWMLWNVLTSLKQVQAIDEIAVLSDGADVLSYATSKSVGTIQCSGTDLNADLEIGRKWALENGALWLLIVHGDLPALKPTEVETMIAHALIDRHKDRGLAVLAPSMDGGTNGLFFSPPDSLPFSFGDNSFDRHWKLAQTHNMQVIRHESPGFRLDVDTVSDVSALLNMNIPVPVWLTALSHT